MSQEHCSLSKSTQRQIKKRFDEEMLADQVPGISHAVYSRDCLLHHAAVGHTNTEKTRAISSDQSILRVASVSKLFVTMAAMQLIDRGLLDPEMKVMQLNRAAFVHVIRNTFKDRQKILQWQKLKVKHLMSHQAGFSKDLPGAFVFWYEFAIRDHAYPDFPTFYLGLRDVKFMYSPGEVHSGVKYSNLAMNMLGRIVEAYNSEGLTFERYVAKNIFAPLGMTNSYYTVPYEKWGLMANQHGLIHNGIRHRLPNVYFPGSYEGSIGVATTAHDMALFGQQLLRVAQLSDNMLLQKKASMHWYLSTVGAMSADQAMANGPYWRVLPGESLSAPLWVGHTGTGYGVRAFLMTSPEQNLGISLQFNANDMSREIYAKIISDAVNTDRVTLSDADRELYAGIRQFIQSIALPTGESAESVKDERVLHRFVGSYHADNKGTQQITIDNGALKFFGHRLIAVNIEKGLFRFPKMNDVLLNGEPVKFVSDDDGTVRSLRMAEVKWFSRLKER